MDAMPNLHPLVVHFPVVLLLLALGLEVGSRLRPWTAAERWCTAAWGLAALGSTAAFLSGREAADDLVGLSATVQPAMGEHADLAQLVLILAWTTLVLKVGQQLLTGRLRTALGVLTLVAGVGANAAMVEAAEHGGALVYQHAVAVKLPACPECAPAPSGAPRPGDAAEALHLEDDGTTLTWTASPAQLAALGAQAWPGSGATLLIEGSEELLLPEVLGDVQVNAWLDLRAFEGTVHLLHHVSDGASGAFTFTTPGGSARLETLAPVAAVLDEAAAARPTKALSVSAAGSHLKGLVDGAVVVHGHTPALPPGQVGLRFEGSGVVGLERLEAVRLAPAP